STRWRSASVTCSRPSPWRRSGRATSSSPTTRGRARDTSTTSPSPPPSSARATASRSSPPPAIPPTSAGLFSPREAPGVYRGGLFIPIMKLYDGGVLDPAMAALIRANVRLPELVMGDFHAQIAGGAVGGERLLEFMGEFGLGGL